jgi:hypothetical protein
LTTNFAQIAEIFHDPGSQDQSFPQVRVEFIEVWNGTFQKPFLQLEYTNMYNMKSLKYATRAKYNVYSVYG